jgi:hypothetical protein
VTDEGIFTFYYRLSASRAQNYVLLMSPPFCRALPYDLPKGHVPLESHVGDNSRKPNALSTPKTGRGGKKALQKKYYKKILQIFYSKKSDRKKGAYRWQKNNL